jgi:hypothetical protein
MAADSTLSRKQLPILLRGEADTINSWIREWNAGRALVYLFVIFIGSGLYGAAMGYARAPLQGVFTGIKFPLLILLTTVGNALLNGMLAPLLGLNITFRQAFLAILMSFTIASLILGSFSPLIMYLVWNSPPMSTEAEVPYRFIQLTHVLAIAFAGIAANLRLFQLLQHLSGSRAIAWKILIAWLAVNLFLGSQLSWIFRPFIGSPHLPVEFLRENAFQGSFYETVFIALRTLFSP